MKTTSFDPWTISKSWLIFFHRKSVGNCAIGKCDIGQEERTTLKGPPKPIQHPWETLKKETLPPNSWRQSVQKVSEPLGCWEEPLSSPQPVGHGLGLVNLQFRAKEKQIHYKSWGPYPQDPVPQVWEMIRYRSLLFPLKAGLRYSKKMCFWCYTHRNIQKHTQGSIHAQEVSSSDVRHNEANFSRSLSKKNLNVAWNPV